MAREANEIYLENTVDIFRVIELVESRKYHEYTVEIYSLKQEVKNSKACGKTCGYDFLYGGVKFYQYITNHPAILNDKDFIDRMFELSFKDALAIR